jgi:hypothetical protein
MKDLHLVVDFLAARLLWLAAAELIVKPFLFRKYNWLDAKVNDSLPDLPSKP